MALFTQNKNIAKIRAILLVIQLFSLLVIGVLWGIGLTIYASKELNNLYNMFEPLVVFGLLGFLWKIKTIVTTALIQITIRVVSIFLSIGITFTSLNLIGITIKLPNIGIIQLNIWIVLTIVSLIFAQSIFKSNNIKENQYDVYPTFQVKEERVIFLIPAYNESKSIEKLVNEIKTEYPKSKIVVVDNNSKDNTGKLAEKAGATLIYESKQGKGNAIKTGFNYISQFEYDVALMLDADLTYKTSDALKLINFLASGGYGVILGSRLKGKREKGAITTFNMIGNYFLTIFANFLYGTNHTDICTGYWLFRKETVDLLNEIGLQSTGFGLEAEMVSLLAQNKVATKDLPINYGARISGKSHLQPFADGWKIFFVLIFNWIFSRKTFA